MTAKPKQFSDYDEESMKGAEMLVKDTLESAPAILDRAARLWPDRPALNCPTSGLALTWRELRDRTNDLAERLVGAGIGKGTVVVVASESTAELVVLAHAVFRSGAVLAPLNLQFTQSETDRYIGTLKREFDILIVSSRSYEAKFAEGDTYRRFGLGSDSSAGWQTLDSLEERGVPPRVVFPTDPSYAIATSGSTSFPKATLATQRGLAHFGHSLVDNVGLTETDRYLNVLPMFHLGGISMALSMVPLAGAELHLLPRFEAGATIKVIPARRITATTAWDGFFDMMAQAEGFTDNVFATLKKCVIAGRSRYYHKLIGWGIERVVTFYGMTEGHMVTVLSADEFDEDMRATTSGRPTEGTDVIIVDPETDEEVSGVGEIRYRGPGLLKHYVGEPELTKEAFDSRGFFKSGDMGYFKGDNLVLVARYKFMVKTGGENVSEAEVEEALLSLVPEIVNVSVVGKPDEIYGEIVFAFVEWVGDRKLGLDQIRGRLRGHIANFKLPRGLAEIQPSTWPQTASGKVDKLKLRAMAAAGAGSTK